VNIDPGQLRHQVKLQQFVETVTAGGGRTKGWSDLSENPTVWAAVEPLDGTERFRAQAVDARMSHRVTMYYHPDVTAKTRILHEGRVLEVIGPPVDENEEHRFLVLYCWENV
jgi:SPP1 family predicted phage head-tail adaptor